MLANSRHRARANPTIRGGKHRKEKKPRPALDSEKLGLLTHPLRDRLCQTKHEHRRELSPALAGPGWHWRDLGASVTAGQVNMSTRRLTLVMGVGKRSKLLARHGPRGGARSKKRAGPQQIRGVDAVGLRIVRIQFKGRGLIKLGPRARPSPNLPFRNLIGPASAVCA